MYLHHALHRNPVWEGETILAKLWGPALLRPKGAGGRDEAFDLTGHKISYLRQLLTLPVLATQLLCLLNREGYSVSDKMDVCMQEFCL